MEDTTVKAPETLNLDRGKRPLQSAVKIPAKQAKQLM
jgi:hypothetical protein